MARSHIASIFGTEIEMVTLLLLSPVWGENMIDFRPLIAYCCNPNTQINPCYILRGAQSELLIYIHRKEVLVCKS